MKEVDLLCGEIIIEISSKLNQRSDKKVLTVVPKLLFIISNSCFVASS